MLYRNYLSRIIVFVIFSLLLSCGSAAWAGGPSKDKANDTKDLFNQEMRTLRTNNMFLPMSYLEVDGVSYGYYLPRRLIQMAKTGTEFRIRKIKTKKNMLKVELETDRKARLKIHVFDAQQKVSATLLDQVFPLMLAEVFEFGTPLETPRVVVNSSSGLSHLGACNHLPADSLRVSFADDTSAVDAGYRLCPACFPPDPPLPFYNYMPIRTAALETARHYERAFPPVADQDLQDRVQTLGETIVGNLPFPEKGFTYRFRVVESEVMQALSFPTGFVYITDKLLAAVEDEAELAHVLAHEITHCELHLRPNPQIPEPNLLIAEKWKEYYKRVRWRETEADLVAISTLAKLYPQKDGADAAINILSKLQFANEAMPLMEGGTYATHPPYGSRLRWLKNGYFPVEATHYFEARDKAGDWFCRVKVLGGGTLKNKSKVIQLLVQVSAEVNEEMKAVSSFADNEFGVGSDSGRGEKIVFTNGKNYDLVPSNREEIAPGTMKILTYGISGLKKKKYGISTPENPINCDPSKLEGLKLSIPGKVKWFMVPVVQE